MKSAAGLGNFFIVIIFSVAERHMFTDTAVMDKMTIPSCEIDSKI